VRDLAGLSKERSSRARERLLAAERIEEVTVKIATHNNAERDGPGLRLARERDDD
jgi:hypothetical protein